MTFLTRLFGLSYEQFAPIVVASARAAASVGGAALIGGILTWLDQVQWSEYVGANGVPYALLVAGTFRGILEGALDQLKTPADF